MSQSDQTVSQAQAVLDFMLFLNDALSRTSNQFEHENACTREEAAILQVIGSQKSMMVKEIARLVPDMDASKLTRLLDSLEQQGYATRTVNPGDRRSFLITPTEKGLGLLNQFTDRLKTLADRTITTLTPTERIILIELFNKIQANWSPDES